MTELMKITDADRRHWTMFDEGLLREWRATRLPIGKYIKQHRLLIDEVIQNVTSGKKEPHYLASE